MADPQQPSQTMQALSGMKGPLSTARMMEVLFRASANVPQSVPRKKIAGSLILERQAANNIINGSNPQSEKNKMTQDSITRSLNEISQSLMILENEGTKAAYDMKTEFQQPYLQLRSEATAFDTERKQKLAGVKAFMVERNKLENKMLGRFKDNPDAEIITLQNELQRQQNIFDKQIEALNTKEAELARKLVTLSERCVRNTKAITGVDIQTMTQEIPRPT